jgi:hypothetical protein
MLVKLNESIVTDRLLIYICKDLMPWTTSTTGTSGAISRSESLALQHFLYFFPEFHQQISLLRGNLAGLNPSDFISSTVWTGLVYPV